MACSAPTFGELTVEKRRKDIEFGNALILPLNVVATSLQLISFRTENQEEKRFMKKKMFSNYHPLTPPNKTRYACHEGSPSHWELYPTL